MKNFQSTQNDQILRFYDNQLKYFTFRKIFLKHSRIGKLPYWEMYDSESLHQNVSKISKLSVISQMGHFKINEFHFWWRGNATITILLNGEITSILIVFHFLILYSLRNSTEYSKSRCKFHQDVGYQVRWGSPAGLHADMRRVITKSKRRARVKLGEIHIIIVADLGRERERFFH